MCVCERGGAKGGVHIDVAHVLSALLYPVLLLLYVLTCIINTMTHAIAWGGGYAGWRTV